MVHQHSCQNPYDFTVIWSKKKLRKSLWIPSSITGNHLHFTKAVYRRPIMCLTIWHCNFFYVQSNREHHLLKFFNTRNKHHCYFKKFLSSLQSKYLKINYVLLRYVYKELCSAFNDMFCHSVAVINSNSSNISKIQ